MILRPLSDEGEELRHAFVHELIDAFGQLLEFQRIGILDITGLFGVKENACEFDFSPSVKVSPILKLPVSYRPTMSPG